VFKYNQSGIVHILMLLILLTGIIAGVYLVKQAQIFQPKAYNVSNVIFTNSSGIKLPESISDPNVYLLINLPKDWKVPGNEGADHT
jgi:hypothetical protein